MRIFSILLLALFVLTGGLGDTVNAVFGVFDTNVSRTVYYRCGGFSYKAELRESVRNDGDSAVQNAVVRLDHRVAVKSAKLKKMGCKTYLVY